ncbi:hypothetical protein EYF80_025051 [Liparis tanakae]|uniref:Uncharacterized protein n=1 Tax=Liparis tanakae TaxID=230148 RepID=A0A4Z2HHJ9_9TELE|nr:hypothetical protein EYF80_025051 [Liparis tanakae]
MNRGWSVGDKQLLLPLTLNQGDSSREKKPNSVEQLYLTSSPSGKSTSPSRLGPRLLPLFPRSGALHIVSQSGTAGCHAARQPREGKCFMSGDNVSAARLRASSKKATLISLSALKVAMADREPSLIRYPRGVAAWPSPASDHF